MANSLDVHRGNAPLIVSFPHTGTDIPPEIETTLTNGWLARKDADWWVDQLYDFAHDMGATTIRTRLSRTVIDVNRDPSGASLYPGQTTTGLCPIETFDGEPLYPGIGPDEAEIARRRTLYFDPYHAALAAEVERLRTHHPAIVLYDAHSIRSHMPRLFNGELPQFNIGTNTGQSCAPELAQAVERACNASPYSRVTDGRFKGGWITRHYGAPQDGVHAIQMELACRGYMREPAAPLAALNWPASFDPEQAAPLATVLRSVLAACIHFAEEQA